MSQIRGKNTKPELVVRKFLYRNGFRYRLHDKKLPGKPDIVLTRLKTVIFVHGCFWHGHENCKYFTIPKTRSEWWTNKINRNIKVDYENYSKLKEKGWDVLIIFECELRSSKKDETLNNLSLNLSTIPRN
jgi:DNA mismatch endonuclease (patch repair protein)